MILVLVSQTYDDADRLLAIDNLNGLGSVITSYVYQYDHVGNRTQETNQAGRVKSYGYNRRYELTSEGGLRVHGWVDWTLSDWQNFDLLGWGVFTLDSTDVTFGYIYDGAGNRLFWNDAVHGLTTYSYDAANQLNHEVHADGTRTTYTYDDAGNRTQKDENGTLTDYKWDQDSRMTLAQPVTGDVTFTYNPIGQRIIKEAPSEQRGFVFDFKNLAAEVDSLGNVKMLYTQSDELYGNLISEFDTDAGESFFHTYDAQGNTDALLDPAGDATDRYQYSAFSLLAGHDLLQ